MQKPKVRYRVHNNPPCPRLWATFRNFFFGEELAPSAYLPTCSTFRFSTPTYSVYSQLPTVSRSHLLSPQLDDAPCRSDRAHVT